MANLAILILNNWKPIVIALAFIISNGWSLNHGMGIVQREQAAAISRSRENNLKVNTEVSNELQAKYTALRKRYDALNRMRTASNMRISDTSSGHNATSGAVGFSGGMDAVVGTLMFQADIQAQQLIACQNWIRRAATR